MGAIIVYVICGVVGLFCLLGLILGKGLRKSHKEQLNNDLATIQSSEPKIKQQLAGLKFNATDHYSHMGYESYEYVKQHHAPNNFNLDIDYNKKLIACYSYLPYFLKVYTFSSIKKCELDIVNGKTQTFSSTYGLGTTIGGIAVGSSDSSGTAYQEIKAILVTVYFTNGDTFSINFCDEYLIQNGINVMVGDSCYMKYLANAKNFVAKIEAIIAQNKEIPSQSVSATNTLCKME